MVLTRAEQTFEHGESDILRNEYFQLGAERVAYFALEYRRLGESAHQEHKLETYNAAKQASTTFVEVYSGKCDPPVKLNKVILQWSILP